MLNHAGVCLSYDSTWLYLKRLTDEARYLQVVNPLSAIGVYIRLTNTSVQRERRIYIRLQNLRNTEQGG